MIEVLGWQCLPLGELGEGGPSHQEGVESWQDSIAVGRLPSTRQIQD